MGALCITADDRGPEDLTSIMSAVTSMCFNAVSQNSGIPAVFSEACNRNAHTTKHSS